MRMLHRIAITGVECTGKSTLAAGLAEALDAVLIDEAARFDAEVISGRVQISTLERLGRIQFKRCLEAEVSARQTGRFHVITDTDATVLSLWAEHAWGQKLAGLEAFARWPQFTLLCAPTIPWVADPLRNLPLESDRWALHEKYQRQVEASGPWGLVDAATPQKRLDQAVRAFLHFASNSGGASK